MKSAFWRKKSTACAALATTLLLTSSCASFTSASRPSVLPDADAASGNAYCATLPPGTRLALPDAASARPLRAVAVNEIEHAEPETGNSLPLAAPLKLVSPAYLAARDAHELQLARLALSATTATNH